MQAIGPFKAEVDVIGTSTWRDDPVIFELLRVAMPEDEINPRRDGWVTDPSIIRDVAEERVAAEIVGLAIERIDTFGADAARESHAHRVCRG